VVVVIPAIAISFFRRECGCFDADQARLSS
jgi:hypothetical protein